MTAVTYDRDIVQVRSLLIYLENWENNWTEEIGLVTLTPGGFLNKQTQFIFRISRLYMTVAETFWPAKYEYNARLQRVIS